MAADAPSPDSGDAPVSAVAGGLTFRFAATDGGSPDPVPDRLSRAADWAAVLDPPLVRGRQPSIRVPPRGPRGSARPAGQTAADYRHLRLPVGDLVRPVLLDPPDESPLHDFQRRGVAWLLEREGGILADDMGLGKTVQVIFALRALFQRGEIRDALVLCPKGMVSTWGREFGRWAPELGVAEMAPPAAIRSEAWKAVYRRRHVLLTNFEQLLDLPGFLVEDPPDAVVADEAHHLRKPGSRVTAAAFRLRPGRFWALTGTPVERDAPDLATLLSLVAPGWFAPSDGKQPASFRSRARRFVLRRKKEDALRDLPRVHERSEILDLTAAQQQAYRSVEAAYLRGDIEPLPGIGRLLDICDFDPESGASVKIDWILDYLAEVRKAGEKAVVFAHRLAPLRELERRASERFGRGASPLLTGAMDARERDREVGRFRRDEAAVALLASTGVGGEGLTLTEANHVLLLNRWWNPSTNRQARDRVARIGQHREVRVVGFRCRNTVEENLERILGEKADIYEETVERLTTTNSLGWVREILEGEGGPRRLLPNPEDPPRS